MLRICRHVSIDHDCDQVVVSREESVCCKPCQMSSCCVASQMISCDVLSELPKYTVCVRKSMLNEIVYAK
jgi:hypothetical protein